MFTVQWSLNKFRSAPELLDDVLNGIDGESKPVGQHLLLGTIAPPK